MQIEALGESAFILRDLAGEAWRVANSLQHRNLPGVHEVVAAYDTVAIYTDPDTFTFNIRTIHAAVADAWDQKVEPKLHIVPVCYELGEDLDEVAKALKLTTGELIDLHANRPYPCAAIGFCPGFPYLRGLPPQLTGVPRKATPRVRIEPGSVGLTGGQTGIYPLERPGGWNLIGHTPLTIVDVEEDYFPITPGDQVAFTPITNKEFEARKGERL